MRKSQGGASQCCTAPIDGACINVCCAILLSNGPVGATCDQSISSEPRGMACRPNGKGSGEEEVLSDVVPALFIRDAPIIGIGRLSAVLPIIGIGLLLRQHRPIIVYTLGKYKFLLYCVSVF